jgi:hypothetical protein
MLRPDLKKHLTLQLVHAARSGSHPVKQASLTTRFVSDEEGDVTFLFGVMREDVMGNVAR